MPKEKIPLGAVAQDPSYTNTVVNTQDDMHTEVEMSQLDLTDNNRNKI